MGYEDREKNGIGGYIKRTREACGISQKAFAQELGMLPSYLAKIESGNRRPKIHTVLQIRDALFLHLESMVGTGALFHIASEAYDLLHDAIDQEYGLGLPIISFDFVNNLTPKEIEIVRALKMLNMQGQSIALERIKELAEIPRYNNTSFIDEKKEAAERN